MLTPRTAAGVLDTCALEAMCHRATNAGAIGLCVNGATGDYAAATNRERRMIVECIRSSARDAKVMAGAGSLNLDQCVALSKQAIRAGADAILLPPPFFFPYGQEDVKEFYREAARRIPGPIILYNLPAFTTAIEAETARALLAGQSLLEGIKDSSGRLDTLDLLSEPGLRRVVRIVGNDSVLAAARLRGVCDAVVSGVAGVLPELIVALFAAASGTERWQRLSDLLDEFVLRLSVWPVPWGLRIFAESLGLCPAYFPMPLSEGRRKQVVADQKWFSEWWPQTAAVLSTAEPKGVLQ